MHSDGSLSAVVLLLTRNCDVFADAIRTYILYARAVSLARLHRNKKLQVERDMERMDKIWILKKYAIVFGQTPQPENVEK